MGELKSRLLFVLGALVVFRLGAHIPVPGIDPLVLDQVFKSQQGGILGMFNMFSGGALSRFTIFALGIMPYISASIFMQIGAAVIPSLEKLQKEGEEGRKKIIQYTRYGTIVLSLLQTFFIALWLENPAAFKGTVIVPNPGWGFRLMCMLTMTTGTFSTALTTSAATIAPFIRLSAPKCSNSAGL